jgi:hypothetical protein
LAGFDEGGKVGPLVVVHRGGHSDDEHIAGRQFGGIQRKPQALGLGQFVGRGFQCAVLPGFQLGNALRVDVKAKRVELLAKFNGQGQAHIAQPDDG